MTEEEDPKSKVFSVSNPVKTGSATTGHIKYTVVGIDADGEFTESRRFREFNSLRTVLVQRWPGIYIPALPEKKLVGGKDDKFVEERRGLLERFMKEIGKIDYLTHSKEFKVFARDRGDIEKILNALPRQTPLQILEKYRLNFNVDEDQEGFQLTKYKDVINEF